MNMEVTRDLEFFVYNSWTTRGKLSNVNRTGGFEMFSFITNIKEKYIGEQGFYFSEKREVSSLSFTKNFDEDVVIEFLRDIDKSYDSNSKGRLEQGNSFENFLLSVFRLAGFDVEVTKKRTLRNGNVHVGDNNVDLILVKGKEKIAVQAKHFRLNALGSKSIGMKDVRQFCGMDDKSYTKKLFITTTLFNPYVYEEIERNDKAKKIEWYDRYGLLQLLNQLIPDTMGKYLFLNSLPSNESVKYFV